MRCLVHISDLHFGRTRRKLLEKLHAEIIQSNPDLLVLSGDLTQRAKPSQFEEAREFLETLPFRKLIVPGNHDIPLWNVFLRFMDPLARYQKNITADLAPLYEDDEISVQGINTAHSRTIAGGRFQIQDVKRIIEHWESLPSNVLRILVSHHPVEILPAQRRTRPGFRIQMPADIELPEHADLILSGHYYREDFLPTEKVMITPERSIVAIQAGAASSLRLSGEANSFNRLKLSNGEIDFEKRSWDEETQEFLTEKNKRFFTRTGVGGFRPPPVASDYLQI